MSIFKNKIIVFPYLFGIFPILFLYANNIGQAKITDTLVPAIIVFSFIFLSLLFFSYIFKDNIKAAIAVSVLILIVFSYGHFLNLILKFILMRERYIIITFVILFIIAFFVIYRSHGKYLNDINKILYFIAISLVLVSLVNILVFKLQTKSINADFNNTNTTMLPKREHAFPDIYYIILDRYSRLDTLLEIYNFDNSSFINYLSEKGFYVASKSTANYLKTAQSLASSLNMGYINHLSEIMGEESDDWHPVNNILENNKVVSYLKSNGYKYIHSGSWWRATSHSRHADIEINLGLSEYSIVLLESTILSPFFGILKIFNSRYEGWKRINYKFNKLSEIPEIKEPTFTFVHFLIPHPPYIFKKDGTFLTEKESQNREDRELYIEQLIYTNKKMRELIENILSNSMITPIIIIQSDEGPYPDEYQNDRKNFNWQTAPKEQLEQKMTILNAYFFPNIDINVLYQSITPVNTFRVLFNHYFDTEYKLLEDRNYVFLDEKHIYKFIEVTDILGSSR